MSCSNLPGNHCWEAGQDPASAWLPVTLCTVSCSCRACMQFVLHHIQMQVTMGQTCRGTPEELVQAARGTNSPAGETTLLRCPACSAGPRGRAPAAGTLPQLRCTAGAPAEKDGCVDEAVEGGRERASANSVSCREPQT